MLIPQTHEVVALSLQKGSNPMVAAQGGRREAGNSPVVCDLIILMLRVIRERMLAPLLFRSVSPCPPQRRTSG